jgi:hypothetical protein
MNKRDDGRREGGREEGRGDGKRKKQYGWSTTKENGVREKKGVMTVVE